jgi:hypothetical protein
MKKKKRFKKIDRLLMEVGEGIALTIEKVIVLQMAVNEAEKSRFEDVNIKQFFDELKAL